MIKMIKENKIVFETLGFFIVIVALWFGYMQFIYYPSFERSIEFSQVTETETKNVSRETFKNVSLETSQKIKYSIEYDTEMNKQALSEVYYYEYDYDVYAPKSIVNIALKAYIIEIDNVEYTLFTDLAGSYYLKYGNFNNFKNGQNVVAKTSKENNFEILGFVENASFTFSYENDFQNEEKINHEINLIIELSQNEIIENL